MRDLPIFIFASVTILLVITEYATMYLPAVGVIGSLIIRMVGGEALRQYPSLGDPSQRLAALVAMVCAIFFYGGFIGPLCFTGSRSVAQLIEAVRLVPSSYPSHVLDQQLRLLAWIGLAVTAWSTSEKLFPWELRGAHEVRGRAPPPPTPTMQDASSVAGPAKDHMEQAGNVRPAPIVQQIRKRK